MKTHEQDLADIETPAWATNRALADLIVLHEDAKALLRKIYNRANPSLFDDASQTRLDSDIMDESRKRRESITSAQCKAENSGEG